VDVLLRALQIVAFVLVALILAARHTAAEPPIISDPVGSA
jgi:hypothetical protein